MIDPNDTLEVQVAKQAKIIDALVRRANRQHEVGTTAYSAFQSAIALQGQIWAKTRDLERTASELESVRHESERSRKTLADAISAMEGGFALFTDGRLEICNDLFTSLLPDISPDIVPGVGIEAYLCALAGSTHLVAADTDLRGLATQLGQGGAGPSVLSCVTELTGDRHFQIGFQRTSSDNLVVLQTEITGIVRQNRSEKESLIDMQAHYLQAAFENMSSGICTFSHDGEVIMHNSRFRELLGVPYTLMQKGTELGQILGFMQLNGLVIDTPALEIELWRERLGRQGRLRRRIRHAGGRVLDLHAHLLPDQGFLVDVKDVTLESRATEMLEKRVAERTAELTLANERLTEQHAVQTSVEEELRLAKERAEAAVSSKTRFLAAASHDLLQPINAAKLLISTLQETAEGTTLSRTVDRLQGSFQSIEQILHALLDISRLDTTDAALTPQDVCLGTLMQGIVEDQMPVAEKKGVQLDIVPSSVFVRSEPRYLMRSIQNLVVNAIQYTDAGGRVLMGCRRHGNRIVLQVWDTGLGISKADQARIFEEFARAKNVPFGSGMGLGLSIVERTCRHLGHEIRVRSAPGRGSVFCLDMEMVPGRRRGADPDLPKTPEDADMDLLVLVVENDPDVLFATTQKLENWGASVFPTSSTEEARRVVEEIGMPPDIILADYQLDDGDTGIHTIRAVREASGVKVPAIIITADRSADLVRTGAHQGFTVLTKPVQLSRLRPLIDWKTRGPGATPLIRITDKSSA
ncbi:hybrid sensor histidine kinase/response regulator [Litorisediminicola beolgyonensis]|uniref:histidine kinase n=1 Tax=Litorisediminicola beolgyonensis TaxID=1173614 RepID=A0ABW3ZPM3_9RHOB